MSTDPKEKNKKITDFTYKVKSNQCLPRNSVKRPKSPNSPTANKCTKLQHTSEQSHTMANSDNSSCKNNNSTMDESLKLVENNTTLQTALVPLISEFRLLRESVDTVHNDYAIERTLSLGRRMN